MNDMTYTWHRGDRITADRLNQTGGIPGFTGKHTELTNKEVGGVIDHADLSVTLAKLKQTVQDLINGALQKSGGTMTGDIFMGPYKVTSTSPPDTDNTLTRKSYVDSGLNLKLARAGDSMTGDLFHMAGTSSRFLDSSNALAGRIAGTLTALSFFSPDGRPVQFQSPVVLPGAPTLNLHAATKKYVDDKIFAGDHTLLINKEVEGVIDHAGGSIPPTKIMSTNEPGYNCVPVIDTPEDIFIWKKYDANEILSMFSSYRGIYWHYNHWCTAYNLDVEIGPQSGVTYASWCAQFRTLAAPGAWARARKCIYGGPTYPETWVRDLANWDVPRIFEVMAEFDNDTNQLIHIVSGGIWDFEHWANTFCHIGFKVWNNELSGTVGNGTNEAILSLGVIQAPESVRLRCEFTPGQYCKFWKNDVYVGQVTAYLPAGHDDAYRLLEASLKNFESQETIFRILEVRVLQRE